MKKLVYTALVIAGVLVACSQKNNQTKEEDNMKKLELTQEWDKVFPKSDKVDHRKVTFETQYGLSLAADIYWPKSPLPASTLGEEQAAAAHHPRRNALRPL